MNTLDQFTVPSPGAQLRVRSYAPLRNAHPGSAIVLLHGLLSSAEIFDVPGLESMSLARRLQNEGIHVVSYDQRGSGDSRADRWTFGLVEHALVDLPAVLSACRERLRLDRIVLLGHSLGGTIWREFLQHGEAHLRLSLPRIVAGIALACPGAFDRRMQPWSDIARRGRSFIDDLDADRDTVVRRAEFAAGQIVLYWPWARHLVRPAAVEAAMKAGGRSLAIAAILRHLPIPTLIYSADDFDNATFRRVLRSRTLDQTSHQLFVELYERIGSDTSRTDAPATVPLPALCIGSTHDRLVPLRAVQTFSESFETARLLATETAFGTPSGHAGYLFKERLRDDVLNEVVTFVGKVFSTGAVDRSAGV